MMASLSGPMVPGPFRVQGVRKETYDTFTLELEPANGADGFPFAGGDRKSVV